LLCSLFSPFNPPSLCSGCGAPLIVLVVAYDALFAAALRSCSKMTSKPTSNAGESCVQTCEHTTNDLDFEYSHPTHWELDP
jgi:hypothetical protein